MVSFVIDCLMDSRSDWETLYLVCNISDENITLKKITGKLLLILIIVGLNDTVIN